MKRDTVISTFQNVRGHLIVTIYVGRKHVHGSHLENMDGNLVYFSFAIFDTSKPDNNEYRKLLTDAFSFTLFSFAWVTEAHGKKP
jgi:hypothetical protein